MATCLGNSTCSSRSSRILLLCMLAANGLLVLADDDTSNKLTAVNASTAPPPADSAAVTSLKPPPIVITNRPLLGQNGTGQRWTNLTQVMQSSSSKQPMVVSEPISPGILSVTAKPDLASASPSESTPGAGKMTTIKPSTTTTTVSPRIATSTNPVAKMDSSTSWEDEYVSNIDTDKTELTEDELRAKNLTLGNEEHHTYYNSTTLQNAESVQEYLKSFQNLTPNSMLSKSHRRAMTVRLKFDFPFYGHLIENITVATGGFIYTGDYVHSWLAATQFIAPLMANFDTSLSNDSFVKYYDNGTSFTVLWENVQLQDLAKRGGFTFSATLHQNGDIIFGYYSIPMSIDSIEDKKHPVKVGLSDAYISDKTVFYTRRKTIFEYHRVNFESTPIKTNTMIILRPEPTCNIMQTCSECTALKTFKCGWCPTMSRCSTGTDRKRHDWLLQGCERSQVTTEAECPSPEVPVRSPSYTNTAQSSMPAAGAPRVQDDRTDERDEDKGHMGTAMGILIPFGLIVLAAGWIMYAYRNPHTKSGQFLIQMNGVKKYRPSQWSWRRGEARYTAATIHM